jgi:hypothetical protein
MAVKEAGLEVHESCPLTGWGEGGGRYIKTNSRSRNSRRLSLSAFCGSDLRGNISRKMICPNYSPVRPIRGLRAIAPQSGANI